MTEVQRGQVGTQDSVEGIEVLALVGRNMRIYLQGELYGHLKVRVKTPSCVQKGRRN